MKNHKASLILLNNLCTLLILFSSSSLAFNITKILSQHQEFETLNSLLSKTKLADEINRRQTITLLAVENSGLLSLAGKPLDVAKNILSVHVVLDYYDVEKLTKLGISSNTTTLTTLFQASGLAVGLQGFVNVSLVNEGEIAFGSAAPGGTLASKLVESVVAQPYNLSVLQITAPVHVPGIESVPVAHPPPPSPPPPPPPALVPVPAPKKSPKLPAPALPPAAPKISPKPAPTLPPPQKKSPPPAPVFPPAPKNSPKPAPVLAPAPKNSPKPGPVLAPSLAPTTPVSDGPVMSAAPASSPSKPDDSSADSEPPAQNTSGGSRGLAVGVGAAGAALVAALAVSCCLVA